MLSGRRSRDEASGQYHLAPADEGGISLSNGDTAGPVRVASVGELKRIWWRNAVINLSFIGGWFFFATLLSLYNAWMFSEKRYGFIWPKFVTSLHMFVQFCCAGALRLIWPHKFNGDYRPSLQVYVRKVIPTAVSSSLDIALSNSSLVAISLAFYTMCKSSSLIFVLLFAFAFRLEVFSIRLVSVILLIFAGVVMMVAAETRFDLVGFLYATSGAAMGGLRWSLTKLIFNDKKLGMDTPPALLFWLSPIMGVTAALSSAVSENWGDIFASKFFEISALPSTIFFLTLPGILAFCMVLTEFYIIQRTGVVPMSIAGIAKEVTTISISAFVFRDEDLTPVNVIGVLITVVGISLFTYHKYKKSVDSPVALDAHGNPIEEDYSEPFELDESEALTRTVPEDDELEVPNGFAVQPSNRSREVLFSVGDEDELDTARDTTFPKPDGTQNVWSDPPPSYDHATG